LIFIHELRIAQISIFFKGRWADFFYLKKKRKRDFSGHLTVGGSIFSEPRKMIKMEKEKTKWNFSAKDPYF
jgi:hypothetical protein